MSNPARTYGAHGNNFNTMSDAPTWKMANAPKGTLRQRDMTSRHGGYDPEAVVVPGFGYEPHGSNFLHDKKTSVVQEFYDKSNQKLIVDAVMRHFQKSQGSKLTTQNVPAIMVTVAMKKAFEIYGETVENAPGTMFGPSAGLTHEMMPPPEAFKDFDMDFVNCNSEAVARLNALTAILLRENIMSEKAMYSRYHADLSGAVHVLEYPSRPGPELRRGHQLNYRYYDDITNRPNSGIGGNRLTQNRVITSAKEGDNVIAASPFGSKVGWGEDTARYYAKR